MESDSSLAILILAASLVAFVGVSVSQGAFLLLGESSGSLWTGGGIAARSVRRLISHYDRTVVLFSLLRMATVLAAGLSLSAWVLRGGGGRWALGVFLAAGVLLLLILTQSIARALGRRYHNQILLVASPALVGAYWVVSPLLWAVERLGVAVQQLRQGGVPGSTDGQFWEEDVTLSFPVEEELREADPEERRMIRAILGMEDVSAREIMVPRVDIVAVEVGTPLEEVTALMADGGHSRILVYQETIDNVVGVVHARDMLQSVTSEKGPTDLTDITREAMFIPDSKPLDQLLRELQERRVSIAVVVDEYGGTEGLVTIEDLLEEIVGEIEDEFAREEPAIVRVGENEAIVDGRVTLDEVNELFQTRLEGDGFDTVGGLLSTELGKIPAAGDAISVEGITLRVLSTSGRRVRKVRVIQQS